MVLALTATRRKGLQFLEILGIDVGLDRLRRIAHLQGIRDDAATYYTNDLDDARSTARHMRNQYTETQS